MYRFGTCPREWNERGGHVRSVHVPLFFYSVYL
jgi:hypothetical protein